ncbi:RnfABCDGE type electron transport complex subunit D [Gloeocapsa sp. PCC 73106]|uniref:RnfABCDGE type electron transport complex subunit D n=1 Tax=Gloeocapsa sp. PCC 73106 TaxID=102232 RepID=UPI0002ACBCD3|nr:RnfABCDGE type electron transport complex subunit D [Gloeocapsa sp. PCC 73106]ELR98884.1 Na+-transporting NADH:ubiquinone oxidoreductase, subunit NqrB [Gloeocapsa sp. PCC 73106]
MRDPRDLQIFLLTSFLTLGVINRDWTLNLNLMGILCLSTLSTQVICSLLVKTDKIAWRSALITTLSLILLLRADSYLTMYLAGSLAIASKFLLRSPQKHFFNPANFGIISAMVLRPDAWVSTGQWGTDYWYLLLFLSTGMMILNKVGRIDTVASFLLAYISLILGRNLWLGWSWDVIEHQLTSGSLLLFAFFMITDPRSTPNAPISRVIWGLSLAVITVILQSFWFIPTAVFWSLFILSPFTVFLDWVWSAPKFNWQNNETPSISN